MFGLDAHFFDNLSKKEVFMKLRDWFKDKKINGDVDTFAQCYYYLQDSFGYVNGVDKKYFVDREEGFRKFYEVDNETPLQECIALLSLIWRSPRFHVEEEFTKAIESNQVYKVLGHICDLLEKE